MAIHDDYGAELIDTLWNVNVLWSRRVASAIKELIDTLWNVNCFKLFLGVLSCLN